MRDSVFKSLTDRLLADQSVYQTRGKGVTSTYSVIYIQPLILRTIIYLSIGICYSSPIIF